MRISDIVLHGNVSRHYYSTTSPFTEPFNPPNHHHHSEAIIVTAAATMATTSSSSSMVVVGVNAGCDEGAGFVPFNSSLCIPCPAGWFCDAMHIIGECARGFWSEQGSSKCLPCGECGWNSSITLQACDSTRDTLCRACPKGLTLKHGVNACTEEESGMSTNLMLFYLLVVLELVILANACCRYCGARARHARLRYEPLSTTLTPMV
jgi:hypothetical protein